ncbi:hypothetical protein ACFO0N_12445 [Halobium salinum]|uniref:Uncharacterized protein n=1 Tax=Halobium salinum TaxID=1364940 RepID=A0ABD5PDM3_9EURY|nr:hypothetical protein [Halobium salinum]
MFDAPIDAWYVWFGTAVAGATLLGVVGSLPTTAPPDATVVADTVDSVAASETAATGEVPLDATALRIGPHRVALRNDAGTAHGSFAFGPVTPVADGSRLQRVVYGTPPNRVFDSPTAFQQAVVEARTREATWETADRTMVVRSTEWGGVDVTLVDA